MTAEEINQLIKNHKIETNLVSDGFHTFGELYEHRIVLFIALAKQLLQNPTNTLPVWKSRRHDNPSPRWQVRRHRDAQSSFRSRAT